MKYFIILLFLCISCSKHEINGATYYVASTGSNTTGNGSSSLPWVTLSYACGRAITSGDIIHILPGTIIETTQSVLRSGVSIEGEGQTSIIHSDIGGTTVTLSLSSGLGNQHISGIRLEGNTDFSSHSGIIVSYRSNVEIFNCTIINFDQEGIVLFNGESETSLAVNNKIHGCIITNCTKYVGVYSSGDSHGAIELYSQDGALIYNNTITCNRTDAYNGNCIDAVAGYLKNVKIYNNTMTKVFHPTHDWDFAMELWCILGGVEIYGNTVEGSIDVVGAKKGSSAFSVWIHDNDLGQPALLDSEATRGIDIEAYSTANPPLRDIVSDMIIERNHIYNVATGINFNISKTNIYCDNNRISYNVIEGIGRLNTSSKGWGMNMSGGSGNYASCTNFRIWNNVFSGANTSNTKMWGIELPDEGNVSNVSVRNNIVQNFNYAPVYATGAVVTTLSVENNLFYNNGNSNAPRYVSTTITGNTTQNNIIGNPLFVLPSDYHLQSNSPAIDKGINVGMPFNGVAPDMGAFEYGSFPDVIKSVYKGEEMIMLNGKSVIY